MKRRPGFTLIEVLVTIFIMAIGLLALLTLFPLGALRMSQALSDDRAAASASAGHNIYGSFRVDTDPQYDPPNSPSLFVTPPSLNFQPAAQTGIGIPIYIDPNGAVNGNNPLGGFTPLGGPASYQTTPTPQTPGIWRLASNVIPGGPTTGNIPEPNGLTGAPQAARYFTLLDDMTFLGNGLPDLSGGGFLQRGDRYTWAYLLHRSPPASTTGAVDLQIVVYSGRSTQVPGGEATYWAPPDTVNVPPQFNAIGLTSVVLQHPAGAPPTIRRGSWILDTSYDDNTTITPTFSVHGDFYRVIGITTLDATHVNLELQDPLIRPTGISAVTVMDSVVEVFKRGTIKANQWEFRNQ